MKRALSLLLSLALLLTLLPAAGAYSQAYGSEVWLRDTDLQDNVTASDNIYWSDYYSQLRHEHYFTYTPGGAARPVAAYGEAVCDRLTTTAAAQSYEAVGYRVVAGINGDYYDTATGFPLGIVISGGQLMAASGDNYAVGFRADGTAKIGQPNVTVTATTDTASHTFSSVNKPRAEQGGVTLMTYDFRSDHTTGTTTSGLNAVCTILGGSAAIGGELLVQVEQIVETAEALPIGEDQVVLTAASTAVYTAQSFMSTLYEGCQVRITCATEDPDWANVTEAIGAYYLLVDNGTVQTGLPTGYAPRTAVGVKANGDVVFYTVDGRQTDYSMGASFKVLAERMVELGCVTAVCLDGGGSTTAVASLPDSASAQLISSPSDKSQRKVTNHLLLVAEPSYFPYADHIYLSIDAPVVLAGQTLAVTANLVDSGYAPVAGEVTLTASAGEFVDGSFTAPQEAGVVTITAQAAGLTASYDVTVIDSPDSLSIRRNGSAISTLTLLPGETVELDAAAVYRHLTLDTTAEDFTWSLSPSVGTVENGVITAAYLESSGTLTVSTGSKSVSIPVQVDADSPFEDTAGHWGGAYMASLYHQGILTGELRDGKLYADPDRGVTRAEFAVLLCRYMGINTADFAEVEVPFTDMEQVASWAADQVRAMYALGIVNGVANADGTQSFSPQDTLTRAQAVTMLGRAGLTQPQSADLSWFSDADQVPAYALEHFQTMVGQGIITGSDGKLAPNGTMTRAAVCKVLNLLAAVKPVEEQIFE